MDRLNKRYIMSMLLLMTILIATNIDYVSAYSNINFKNITSEDGLPQGTVETIIQDNKGYIWLGTNDGLSRYNGYEFKTYKHDEESKNSITNNYIVDIKQDKSENVWVGTANGLSKIDTKTDVITNYNINDEKKLSHYNIGDVLVTKSGDILIGTSDGLNIYDEKNDQFNKIFDKKNDLSSQHIYSLAEDGDKNIWVATNNGIDKIDIKNNKVIKRFKAGNSEYDISENSVYVVRYDRNGYIWAGTFKEGLNRININSNKVKQYKNDYNDEKSIPGNFVKDILRDTRGRLWVATDNGLAKYNNETEEFTYYKNKIYDKTSLVNDEVFSIIEDRSGLIWVGTYAGISLFDPSTNIEHYKKDPFGGNSISDNSIHGIYEDEEGLLWVGTNSNGVNIINRKNNNIKHINKTSKNYSISNDNINDIAGVDNKIYIATKNGLNEIDKDSKTVKVYNTKNGICNDNITALFVDSKKNLWIGTAKGISILNTNTNEIIDKTTEILINNNIDDKYIKAIYEDSKGNYWIGCFIDGGLVKIDPHKKIIENYRNKKEDNKSISSNNIRSIVEDDKGNLYIGTSYGLNKLDESNNKFERYSEKDGLSNNTVYGLLVDDNSNLWASTNSGISKLDTNTMTFETFNIIDGFQGNEFNGRAYYKNKSGELFFGGTNGLNIFNPLKINRSGYISKVIFDEFKVNGNIYKDINNLTFKYNENTINISVFTPNYKNTKSIQYMYKLEGSGSDWDISNSNNINYSNLDPGKYTLKIVARTYNGQVSNKNSITFTISPPFWKSKVAIILYILIIVIVIYSIVISVKRLDNLVKKRTKQLIEEMEKNNNLLNKVIDLEKRKNSYFVNLSHELRTPLNVIYSTEQLITELNKKNHGIDKDKLNGYMQVVRRNTSRLLNLINNLIDTTKIESGTYQLNIMEHDIVYIVEEATLSLKDYIERKGIELIIDPEIEEKIISCDEYEIERCIVNLVSNAAKFTPAGGTIEVIVKDLGEKAMIIVKDTGIGIDKKYHDLIFNRFNQVVDKNAESKGGSGLGLTITKQIIDMHGGEIYVESELNKGTKFIIIL